MQNEIKPEQSHENHHFTPGRIAPTPPSSKQSLNCEVNNELPPPPPTELLNKLVLKEHTNQENVSNELPQPPSELLSTFDEQNYYVNYQDEINESNSDYVNASYQNQLNEKPISPRKNEVSLRIGDQSFQVNNGNKTENRISTFLDGQTETKKTVNIAESKSQLNQAIALGAFNLKKTIINNNLKENSSANFLAREPNVLSILTLVNENVNNDEENTDDDDEW